MRYISTYRDTKGAAAAVDEQEDYDEKKRPWYAFWRKESGPGGAIDIPADWLETDINTGLTTEEVERRRRKTGFNELADIKENMFLKFVGFFRGPVLYGKFLNPVLSCWDSAIGWPFLTSHSPAFLCHWAVAIRITC